jgi:hypothetical protein
MKAIRDSSKEALKWSAWAPQPTDPLQKQLLGAGFMHTATWLLMDASHLNDPQFVYAV